MAEKTKKIKIEDDGMIRFESDGRETWNLHVQHVEVFTGEDDTIETKCIKVTGKRSEKSHKAQLLVSREKVPDGKPSYERLRYEPGVRVYFTEEGTEHHDEPAVHGISIAHHKGHIYIRPL